MKALRKYLDKIKPNFEEGGKHPKLKSTFEAFESFLFVPNETTGTKGAHIRDAVDLKRTITMVIIALLPALFF
jgi:Na+-transporting NADH:ubiquinone oxidoreductase subunit B